MFLFGLGDRNRYIYVARYSSNGKNMFIFQDVIIAATKVAENKPPVSRKSKLANVQNELGELSVSWAEEKARLEKIINSEESGLDLPSKVNRKSSIYNGSLFKVSKDVENLEESIKIVEYLDEKLEKVENEFNLDVTNLQEDEGDFEVDILYNINNISIFWNNK